MFPLVVGTFVVISAFAIRRGPVGAMGIFVLYIWLSALLPYVEPEPFGFSLQEDAAQLGGASADIAMLLIIAFMFCASQFDPKYAPIGRFEGRYAVGPSSALSNKFALFAILFLATFIAVVSYGAGGLEEAIQLNYRRAPVSDSAMNYSKIPLTFGMISAVFSFRYRTTNFSISVLAVTFGAICAFLSGGRSVAIIYVLSIFYADILRMSFVKLLPACLAGLAAILFISSAMLDQRREAQLGSPTRSEKGILENGTFGLIAVDDVAMAVEYVDRYGHNATEVYLPIAALPIPRDLWPDKPVQISRVLRGFKHGDTNGGLPAGLVGESYIAGSWSLVAIVGLIFGFALSVIDRISSIAKKVRHPAAEAIGGIFGALLAFQLFRGGFDVAAMQIVIALAACAFSLRFVRKATVRAHMTSLASARLANTHRHTT